MRDWGILVRWCRLFDHDGDFCRICLMLNRWWFKHVLKRNPTLIRKR